MATRGAFLARLFAPVDIASLVFFRIAFGTLLAFEVLSFFYHGWIQGSYIAPTYHFTYYGFEWVRPWPGIGMYIHFIALGVLAMCIAIGLWYRVSTVLFFLGFTYVFLLEQSYYLNHFYLIVLISFLMIFIPAHRSFSVDALERPQIRSETAPAWALWVLMAQMAIVYFYGGLAKLNEDWFQGEPMRGWMAQGTDFPLIGPLFTEEWMVYLISYGGLLFDLLVVPLLLWRRTRLIAFAFALGFHLMNSQLFTIGIFPWLAIAATMLFFPPSWPRRFVGFVRRSLRRGPHRQEEVSESEHEEEEQQQTQGEATRAAVQRGEDVPSAAPTGLRTHQWIIVSLLGVFLAVQLLMPLRHFLYPGDSSWTHEGHRFAWQMMLRDVQGEAMFYATDPVSGHTWQIDPRNHLTARQAKRVTQYPDIALQFSHRIAERFQAMGYEQIEVRAHVVASLNGRDYQYLIDPTVDLAKQPRTLAPAPWIVPLEEPLPPPS
ncbi:MAG: HTTM domain-containing protein [Actinomycetota bacterium]|nr:HTTM domain-containing protein [Actinomycetota bacterium]